MLEIILHPMPPIVMPINTAGYSAQKAPTRYNAKEVKDYTDAGFIYVNAGCRGREMVEIILGEPLGE
jgi:hypothetical protein